MCLSGRAATACLSFQPQSFALTVAPAQSIINLLRFTRVSIHLPDRRSSGEVLDSGEVGRRVDLHRLVISEGHRTESVLPDAESQPALGEYTVLIELRDDLRLVCCRRHACSPGLLTLFAAVLL